MQDLRIYFEGYIGLEVNGRECMRTARNRGEVTQLVVSDGKLFKLAKGGQKRKQTTQVMLIG